MRLLKWLAKFQDRRHDVVNAYKTVFLNTYYGKIVLADLCKHGYVELNTFNETSERKTCFNEGRRAMVLHILNTLDLNQNELMQMYKKEAD